MGFIANFKNKIAQKRATKVFENNHARWERDKELLEKLTKVFSDAKKGVDATENTVVQKDGEIILWKGDSVFHETRRGPSTYVGGSQGFSIPIVAGIRFRVGAMRGSIVPGTNSQADLDSGVVLLSTTRILFSGQMYTKEWLLSKLINASTTENENDYFFSVSNREKTSGIKFTGNDGHEFNRFLALAITAAEDGIDAVLKELAEIGKRLPAEEPKLELPDN